MDPVALAHRLYDLALTARPDLPRWPSYSSGAATREYFVEIFPGLLELAGQGRTRRAMQSLFDIHQDGAAPLVYLVAELWRGLPDLPPEESAGSEALSALLSAFERHEPFDDPMPARNAAGAVAASKELAGRMDPVAFAGFLYDLALAARPDRPDWHESIEGHGTRADLARVMLRLFGMAVHERRGAGDRQFILALLETEIAWVLILALDEGRETPGLHPEIRAHIDSLRRLLNWAEDTGTATTERRPALH